MATFGAPSSVGTSVATGELDDNAVTDAKIAAHTTTKITVPTTLLSGTIATSQYAAGSVDAAAIGADVVGDSEVASHTTTKIATNLNTARISPTINSWGAARPAGWSEIVLTNVTVTYNTTFAMACPTTASSKGVCCHYLALSHSDYRVVTNFSGTSLAEQDFWFGLGQGQDVNVATANATNFIGFTTQATGYQGTVTSAGTASQTAGFTPGDELVAQNWDINWNRGSVEFLQNAVSRGSLTTNLPDDKTLGIFVGAGTTATGASAARTITVTSFAAI